LNRLKLLVLPRTEEPAWNLAAEDVLLRRLDLNSGPYLFFYINKPCLVIGRNQNPLVEINLAETAEANLEFFRRISGGGTVYQDPGNLNFSFFTVNSPAIFDNYPALLRPLIEYFAGLNIDLEINPRNDLLLQGKKISGNARFASRDKLLSHGTLLINADLGKLGRFIRPAPLLEIETKASASRRSPVTSLSSVRTGLTAGEVHLGLERYFLENLQGELYSPPGQWLAEIDRLAEERFRHREWKYGRTPHFVYHLPLVNLPESGVDQNRQKSLHLEIEDFHLKNIQVKGLPESDLEQAGRLTGQFWSRETAEILSNALNKCGHMPFGNLHYNFGF